MRKFCNNLLFKLRPTASGNDGYFDDREKVMQQSGHCGIDRRFAFGKCSIQIEHN